MFRKKLVPLFPSAVKAAHEMREKDAALYEQVKDLPFPEARRIWQETYPENTIDQDKRDYRAEPEPGAYAINPGGLTKVLAFIGLVTVVYIFGGYVYRAMAALLIPMFGG